MNTTKRRAFGPHPEFRHNSKWNAYFGEGWRCEPAHAKSFSRAERLSLKMTGFNSRFQFLHPSFPHARDATQDSDRHFWIARRPLSVRRAGAGAAAGGFAVVVATSETYRDLIIEEGLCFAAIRPDVEEATARLGMDLGEIARRMSADDGFLFKRLIFPFLHEAYDQLYAVSEGAVAVVAHSIAFAAHAVAEKRGLPLFVVTLSPLMLYSAYDPPLGTRAPFVAAPRRTLALAYNRTLLRAFAWAAAPWAAPLREISARGRPAAPRRVRPVRRRGAGVKPSRCTRSCWRRRGPITRPIF